MTRVLSSLALMLFVACAEEAPGGGGSGGGPTNGGSPEGGAATGGAPEGGAGGSGSTAECQSHCLFLESLAATANCGYDGSQCIPGCEEDVAAACATELLAWYACLEEQPAEDFVCVDGAFTLTGGACDATAGALVTCQDG